MLFTPFLACGGPVLSPFETALVLSVIVGWLASFVLCFVNLAIILMMTARRSFKLVQSAVIALCIGLTALLYYLTIGGLQNRPSSHEPNGAVTAVVMVLPFLIPLLVIGQFIYLLLYRRRLKLENKKTAQQLAGNVRAH